MPQAVRSGKPRPYSANAGFSVKRNEPLMRAWHRVLIDDHD
jgi:hypothetical protein